jgi:CRISPR-associated endonuclease/helicase Cas3
MLDTAAVFLVLWDELVGARMRRRVAEALGVGAGECRGVLAFWAALHDLGKISPPFQAQVSAAFSKVRDEYPFVPGAERERSFRHEIASHWALTALFAEAGYPGTAKRTLSGAVSHQIAQMLGGHHGEFGAVLKRWEVDRASEYEPGLGKEAWARQRRAHFTELRRITGGGAVPVAGLPAELAVVVTGLVVVSDWLASQTGAITSLMRGHGAAWEATSDALDAHWKLACAQAPSLVREARLGRAEFAAANFGSMFAFAPNPLQKDLVENLPGLMGDGGSGLVLVTAPTGDGKTEAALYAASVMARASGARGLYFALPTMATADGMYPRVSEFADSALEGERALTLLHSMAWLSPAYTGPSSDDGRDAGAESGGEISTGRQSALEADAWLRGHRRGLLASLGVGTIDQALAATLPLTHNALRLFALSDKVFVVDEAHAYGPWMHKLLTILLEWLGAFRAPVVLLSATLTGRTATSLVDAYRRGAGHLEPSSVQPRYPGWLFVDSATGEVSQPRPTATERARTLKVTVRQVLWDSNALPAVPARPGGRRGTLRAELRRVADGGGTALVCCTTVAEAQATYRDLCTAFPDLAATEGGLRLLHSRYPAQRRRKITEHCEAAFGKPRGPEDAARSRPASILVATQVVEQSLDFDFDLVISDLAPVAQLLQRAGRARRHARGETGRPRWAQPEERPELIVLEPVDADGQTAPPPTWGSVYPHSLLVRTAQLLRRHTSGIAVPADVQHLVDAVYAEEFVDTIEASSQRELRAMDAERQAEEAAERHLAAMAGIGAPADVNGDLHRLSRREAGVTEELLTTRLGADTGRLLCLYEQPEGTLTLDEAGGLKLPGADGSALTRADLAQIMARVAPVPGKWLLGEAVEQLAAASWQKHPMLRDVVLLRVRCEGADHWVGQHGGREIAISAETGIELR